MLSGEAAKTATPQDAAGVRCGVLLASLCVPADRCAPLGALTASARFCSCLSHAPKVSAEEALLDFSRPASVLHNKVRIMPRRRGRTLPGWRHCGCFILCLRTATCAARRERPGQGVRGLARVPLLAPDWHGGAAQGGDCGEPRPEGHHHKVSAAVCGGDGPAHRLPAVDREGGVRIGRPLPWRKATQ